MFLEKVKKTFLFQIILAKIDFVLSWCYSSMLFDVVYKWGTASHPLCKKTLSLFTFFFSYGLKLQTKTGKTNKS